jgi:hypothetical protein
MVVKFGDDRYSVLVGFPIEFALFDSSRPAG